MLLRYIFKYTNVLKYVLKYIYFWILPAHHCDYYNLFRNTLPFI